MKMKALLMTKAVIQMLIAVILSVRSAVSLTLDLWLCPPLSALHRCPFLSVFHSNRVFLHLFLLSVSSLDQKLVKEVSQVKLAAENGTGPILASPDLKGLVEFMKSGRCKRVVVMTGAGVSVAAGIPDFRSPGTGLYSNLQKYDLPTPEAIFTLDYFRRNPKPFYVLAKELYPGQYDGTKCHYFIRLLHEKGMLLRNYTQNIDTLEVSTGIPDDLLVFAHGSYASASCIECHHPHTREWVKEEVFADRIPKCSKCTKGLVKPDIVFFGENLPDRFFDLAKVDFPQADLLIVMGTSLTVYPFAGLISKVGFNVPRVLINRDPVGAATPMMLMRGHLGFDFGGNSNTRDVPLLGDCQETVETLVQLLGWEDDFKALMASSTFKKDATSASSSKPTEKSATPSKSA